MISLAPYSPHFGDQILGPSDVFHTPNYNFITKCVYCLTNCMMIFNIFMNIVRENLKNKLKYILYSVAFNYGVVF